MIAQMYSVQLEYQLKNMIKSLTPVKMMILMLNSSMQLSLEWAEDLENIYVGWTGIKEKRTSTQFSRDMDSHEAW